MQDIPEAVTEASKKISIVWFIPLVAVIIGAWLVYKAYTEQGPTITISFNTAQGLEAGKTKIKYKNVEVGEVEAIDLGKDLGNVIVSARMVKDSEDYLTENTRFWVVRARVAAGEVSGLGTLFSGAYIGVDPGRGGEPAREYTGLEKPPVVTTDLPGRHFILRSEKLGSLDVGSPVYFRQINVGQVVGYALDEAGKAVDVKVFIYKPHYERVRENTRFWNAGGVEFSLDANGIKVDTESLISILSGGIAFDTSLDLEPGEQVAENEIFILYDSYHAAQEKSYVKKTYWVLNFQESVRGLAKGAPVEFRGIKVGRVVDIKLELLVDGPSFLIPVLVEIEPERIRLIGGALPGSMPESEPDELRQEFIDTLIEKGLRAQLKPGSLLTGQIYVDFDIHPEAPPAPVVYGGKYPVFPTVPAPLEQIRTMVNRMFDRVEKLPVEQVVQDLQETLQGANRLVNSTELQGSVNALNATLQQTKQLTTKVNRGMTPEIMTMVSQTRDTMNSAEQLLNAYAPLDKDLKLMLEEFSRAARSFRDLTDYLERNPNAMIRGKTRNQ
jgi:paraquat-inducible protein B